MRRAGFGATGATVDTVASGDLAAYVATALGTDFDDDPGARATPLPELDPWRKPPGEAADADERSGYNARLARQMDSLARWWLLRMVSVNQPVGEKLAFLWHNHFATSARKVRFAALMAAQNQKLRALCLGDFRDLAYAMLTDAAMLRWLDGQTNTAASANENMAREFLELFALGHGNGYTESDVREGARALTGWVVAPDGGTKLIASRHDRSAKTILGVRGDFDAAGFCDVVLAHAASPRHVATRLWRQLASHTDPSPPALERLLTAYGESRDLKALTAAILTDPEFRGGTATIVTSPVEWVVGLIRTLRVPITQPATIAAAERTLRDLGQQPFYPPDVGGWPYGRAWLSTASAGARFRAASAMVRDGDISAVSDAPRSDRVDAVGYLIGVGAWSDSSAAALRSLVNQPNRLVIAAVNTPEYLTS